MWQDIHQVIDDEKSYWGMENNLNVYLEYFCNTYVLLL